MSKLTAAQYGNLFNLFEDLEGGGSTPNLDFKALVFLGCLNFSSGSPLGFLSSSNVAGMGHVVKDNGAGLPEFYSNVGIRSGVGTNYNTNTNSGITPFSQIVHIVDSVISGAAFVPIANGLDNFTYFTQDAQGAMAGHSDVHTYWLEGVYNNHLTADPNVDGLFNIEANEISWFGFSGGNNGLGVWAKRGDNVWLASNGAAPGIYKYSYAAGIGDPTPGWNPPSIGPVGPNNLAGTKLYKGIQATPNFLWLLDINNALGSAVYKCDYSGNLITSYPLNLVGPHVLSGAAKEDETAYFIWTNTPSYRLYKLNTNDGSVGLYFSFTVPPNPTCNGYGTDGSFANNMHIFNDEFWLCSPNGLGGGGFVARVALRR